MTENREKRIEEIRKIINDEKEGVSSPSIETYKFLLSEIDRLNKEIEELTATLNSMGQGQGEG